MKAVLLIAIVLSLSSVSLAFSDVSRCTATNNLTCNNETNCLAIDFTIVPSVNPGGLFVGDYFYYNVLLYGISNRTLIENFTVSVYNPENVLLDYSQYTNVTINYSGYSQLYPNLTGHTHKIFPFDSLGVYRIEVVSQSDDTKIFYFSQDCKNYVFFPKNYTYRFDILPSSETVVLQKMENLTTLFDASSKQNERLSQAVIILTLILVMVALYEKIKDHSEGIIMLSGWFILLIFVSIVGSWYGLGTIATIIFMIASFTVLILSNNSRVHISENIRELSHGTFLTLSAGLIFSVLFTIIVQYIAPNFFSEYVVINISYLIVLAVPLLALLARFVRH